jgi:enamine deaminase RidA (YjgF/YER057c/UK114 family)
LSLLLLLAFVAAEYQHVGAVYCREFRDCMEQMPKGKIVATTVYLADIADYGAMNRVYEGYFPGLKPARNTVAVGLPPGMRMGINAIRYTGEAELRGLTPPNVTNIVPITPGIVTPDRLFIAGILGRDSNTGKVPETAEEQIAMCLGRLSNVLATAKLKPGDLAQASVYHSAAIPRELIETKLKLYFGPHPTVALTILEVPALALGANIGLNGIALFLHTGV